MKKFICILALVFISFIIPTNITAQEKTKSIEEQFEKLQNDIDSKLTLDDKGRYIFNENEIISLVQVFDVDELNSYYNLNYSKESLSKKIISLIRNFKAEDIITIPDSSCKLRGGCTGVNRVEKYWNYHRNFCDYDKTQDWIREEKNQSHLAGVLSVFTPFGGMALTVNGFYCEALANALSANCSCRGTITDINTFTGVFSVKPQ